VPEARHRERWCFSHYLERLPANTKKAMITIITEVENKIA